MTKWVHSAHQSVYPSFSTSLSDVHKNASHTKLIFLSEFGEAVVTYEEVVKIEPQLRHPRPIVLVAPRGGPFNMDALRTQIVQNNPERFGSPIPRKIRLDYSYICPVDYM